MLCVAYKPFRLIVVTLIVIMLSVIMVNVMTPNERFIFSTDKYSSLVGKSDSYKRKRFIRLAPGQKPREMEQSDFDIKTKKQK